MGGGEDGLTTTCEWAVIDRSAAESITIVLVNASGQKSRPACPVRPKTGMKETAMIRREKKIAGVTSRAASAIRR